MVQGVKDLIPLAPRAFSSERTLPLSTPSTHTYPDPKSHWFCSQVPVPHPLTPHSAAQLHLSPPTAPAPTGKSACPVPGIRLLQQEGITVSQVGQLPASNRCAADPCFRIENLQVLYSSTSFFDVRPITESHAPTKSFSCLTMFSLCGSHLIPNVRKLNITAFIFFPLIQPLSSLLSAKLKQPHVVQFCYWNLLSTLFPGPTLDSPPIEAKVDTRVNKGLSGS